MAELVFDILSNRLHGVANGVKFEIYAVSGGRASGRNEAQPSLVNNPLSTKKKHSRYNLGRTIPRGKYRISPARPSVYGDRWLKLEQLNSWELLETALRTDLFIHATGIFGNDGCLLPVAPRSRFNELLKAIGLDRGGMLYVR